MKGKQNIFKKLLCYITYKKPDEIKEFTVPEINESSGSGNGTSEKLNNIAKENQGSKHNNGYYRVKKTCSSNSTSNNTSKNVSNNISKNIDENIAAIKESFNYPINKDIILREFKVDGKYRAFIAYIDGMADRNIINNFILRPLLRDNFVDGNKEACKLDYILESIIETNQAEKVEDLDSAIYKILTGDTGLYVENCNYFIFSETKGYDKRGVEKPQSEGVVKGAQEGFNENLRTNITLLRKIIKNNNLTSEFLKIGQRNNNLCAIVYIDGLINPAIVAEVKRRINGIKTDFISGAGMLEQFIEDNPFSFIPTLLSTERPDRTASHIIEGKIAIIAEGTPTAIIAPVNISALLHSSEDMNLRWQYGTLARFVRLFAVLVAMLLPGLYIAITNFHQEMIPTELLIAIGKARENVPFPTIVEVLFMEASFELIREAGLRIPGALGSTIGIIGALILGQAAVQADIISPILIIIIAITGLGSFAIPDFSFSFGARIIRLLFIAAGVFLGLYAISLLFIAMMVIASDLKSFGVPFFSPMGAKMRKSHDFIIRYPLWKQELQPDHINPADVKRQPHISREWIKEDSEFNNEGDNSHV